MPNYAVRCISRNKWNFSELFLGKFCIMSKQKEIKKIPIEEVIEYFRSEGMELTKEEAELVMEFLYNLTLMVIKQYFDTDQK